MFFDEDEETGFERVNIHELDAYCGKMLSRAKLALAKYEIASTKNLSFDDLSQYDVKNTDRDARYGILRLSTLINTKVSTSYLLPANPECYLNFALFAECVEKERKVEKNEFCYDESKEKIEELSEYNRHLQGYMEFMNGMTKLAKVFRHKLFLEKEGSIFSPPKTEEFSPPPDTFLEKLEKQDSENLLSLLPNEITSGKLYTYHIISTSVAKQYPNSAEHQDIYKQLYYLTYLYEKATLGPDWEKAKDQHLFNPDSKLIQEILDIKIEGKTVEEIAEENSNINLALKLFSWKSPPEKEAKKQI